MCECCRRRVTGSDEALPFDCPRLKLLTLVLPASCNSWCRSSCGADADVPLLRRPSNAVRRRMLSQWQHLLHCASNQRRPLQRTDLLCARRILTLPAACAPDALHSLRFGFAWAPGAGSARSARDAGISSSSACSLPCTGRRELTGNACSHRPISSFFNRHLLQGRRPCAAAASHAIAMLCMRRSR